jgi:hypothetical protein
VSISDSLRIACILLSSPAQSQSAANASSPLLFWLKGQMKASSAKSNAERAGHILPGCLNSITKNYEKPVPPASQQWLIANCCCKTGANLVLVGHHVIEGARRRIERAREHLDRVRAMPCGHSCRAAHRQGERMMIPISLVEEAHAAGLSVIPPAQDGTKRPYVPGSKGGAWKMYQSQRPPLALLTQWYDPRNGLTGIGLACGAVSGNLEVLDFDTLAAWETLPPTRRILRHGIAAGADLGGVWRDFPAWRACDVSLHGNHRQHQIGA